MKWPKIIINAFERLAPYQSLFASPLLLSTESSTASKHLQYGGFPSSHRTMDWLYSNSLPPTYSQITPPLFHLYYSVKRSMYSLTYLPTDARWCSTAMQIVASKASERKGSFTASQQKDSKSKSWETWKRTRGNKRGGRFGAHRMQGKPM